MRAMRMRMMIMAITTKVLGVVRCDSWSSSSSRILDD